MRLTISKVEDESTSERSNQCQHCGKIYSLEEAAQFVAHRVMCGMLKDEFGKCPRETKKTVRKMLKKNEMDRLISMVTKHSCGDDCEPLEPIPYNTAFFPEAKWLIEYNIKCLEARKARKAQNNQCTECEEKE